MARASGWEERAVGDGEGPTRPVPCYRKRTADR